VIKALKLLVSLFLLFSLLKKFNFKGTVSCIHKFYFLMGEEFENKELKIFVFSTEAQGLGIWRFKQVLKALKPDA
jgi:hypothetical protein